jgi:hypothetical protein
VYYVYGEELARILTEKLGIAVNPLPTQGSIQNVKLIDSGAAQHGLITMSTGLEGWDGRARLDQREALPEYACAVSDQIDWAFARPCSAGIGKLKGPIALAPTDLEPQRRPAIAAPSP